MVQGEIMKIKKWNFRIFEGFQGGFLFLLGFLVGTVLPNLLWKMQWKQETVHVFYLLGAFAGGIFEGFQGGFLFLLGFLVGTVLPNLLWKMQWKQETVHVFYLLGAFAGEDVSGKEYFFQVLAQRGGWLFICMLCGFSVFGVPVSVLTMLGEGIKTGAILSMSILQFGFVGGAAGLALLFPHEIVYLIVFFYFSGTGSSFSS